MLLPNRLSSTAKLLAQLTGIVTLFLATNFAHAVPSWSMDMAYETRTGNDRVYVVNPDHDTVAVVDTFTGNRIAEIAVGDEPRTLALDAFGYMWVVNKNSSSISIINTATLNVVNTLRLAYGARPHGIVIDNNANRAYIVLEALRSVIQMSTITGAILNTAGVGSHPRSVSINNDGSRIFLPRFITSPVAGESGVNVANGGGEVVVLATSNLARTNTIAIPFNFAFSGQDTNISARGVPNYMRSMAISPSGNVALVPAKIDNLHRGTRRDGRGREHNLLTRGILSRINMNTQAQNGRIEFVNNSQPTAVAFGPNDNIAFAVHEGSRAFEAINVNTGAILYQTTLGFAPTGVIASPDGTRVYVHNWLSRTMSILNTFNLVNGISNNAFVINNVDLTSREVLNSTVLFGKQLFHDSADPRLSAQRYISCASCHDEGGADGRTWDFSDVGEGLRNTADLRGRGDMEDGLVHWTANFDEIQDFEHALREIFDGQGLMSDAAFNATNVSIDPNRMKTGRSGPLDALVAFIDTFDNHGVSPFRNQNGTLTAQGVRGREVFRAASCATCHSGEDFTDSPLGGSHNVGTVDAQTGGRFGQPLLRGGLDTPTLMGLWNDAPYMHDGAARTVWDAIRAHTNNMPVSLASFSNAQINDLASYVIQIDDTEPPPLPPIVDPPTPDTFSTFANITIDGNMSDWPAASFLINDARDASDGAANQLDYETVWMANNNENIFIRYRNHQPYNTRLTWGYGQALDTDPRTGFRPTNNRIPFGADYLIEEQSLYRYTGNGTTWSWAWVGTIPIRFNGRDAELSVPRTMLGNPDLINMFFYTDNNAIGGSAIDFIPNSTTNTSLPLSDRYGTYELSGDGPPPPPPPPGDDPFVYYNRVNSLNVDGSSADWAGLEFFPLDPYDVAGNSIQIDFRQAGVAHNNSNFYFGWNNDGATRITWGNAIFVDTDLSFNTGFRGFNNESPIGIDYLIEAASVYRYVGNGNSWVWQWVGQTFPVTSGDNLELRVPMNLLGSPVTMDLFFYGDSSAVGGTGVDFYPDGALNGNSAITARRFRYTRNISIAGPPEGQEVSDLSAQEQ